MGLFGSRKQSYIGVDLGAGGIKFCELQNEKGRARLVTYSFTERLPDAEPMNLIDAPKDTVDLLKKMVQKAKTTTTRAVAGLPIASVFSAVITVPKTANEKDFKEAVHWQAKKLIPVPLEDMVLDFKKITAPEEKKRSEKKGGKEGKGKKAEKKDDAKTQPVLITGASKAMVQKYVTIFKQAGLELVSLETEAFALIRALVGKDRSTTMIVDIGALRTNIIIVENGIPYVTRSLDMGGATFTKAIGATLSMDMRSAEQMKCDIKSVSSIYPGEGLPKVFDSALQPLVTELKYSMGIHTGAQEKSVQGKQVEKIILTGGSALLPSLSDYVAKQLGLRTYVGDPWARVVYPDGLRNVLDEIGPRFAVPIGLAMRDIE